MFLAMKEALQQTLAQADTFTNQSLSAKLCRQYPSTWLGLKSYRNQPHLILKAGVHVGY